MKYKRGCLYGTFNEPDQLINLYIAYNPWTRLKGLLGLPELKNEALLLKPCNSIHTLGMKYSLDIVFLDKNNCIIKTVKHLKPARMALKSGASSVLEFRSGAVEQFGFKLGQTLKWKEYNDI